LKKLKLFYNPFSGDKSFKHSIDEAVRVFQRAGFETHLCRGEKPGDVAENIAQTDPDFYDAYVVSGGDGTINIAANAMLNHGHDVPVGIIPSGTANDLATYLKIPKEISKAAKVITDGRIVPCDVGSANGRYFINVCAGGLFTNVSNQIDREFKNTLGKFAYYIEGLGQLSGISPLPVRITNSTDVFTEEIYLFLVLNTSGTGGFNDISPESSVSDGLFEFIAIKARPLRELAVLMVKMLKRDIINDSNIIYFKDEYIKIEPLFEDEKFFVTDVDGEKGPEMPIEIRNLRNRLRIFMPN